MSVEECKTVSLLEIETKMTYIELDMIEEACGNIEEGDGIIVEYIDDKVISVYEKSDEEKDRRIELFCK